MDEAVVRFLSGTELMAHVPEDMLTRIATHAQVRKLNAGQVVYEQGTIAEFLYFIYAGSVELKCMDALTGRDFLFALYGPGKSIGEEGVLLDDPYSVTAIVAEESHLVALPRDHFRTAMSRLPQIGVAASQIMARRANRLLNDKGVRFISLAKIPFDPDVVRMLPGRVIKEHRVVPIAHRGRTLSVAMVNPHDLVASDEVQRNARGYYVEVVGVAGADFDVWMNKHVLPLLEGVQVAEDPHVLAPMPPRRHALEFQSEGEAEGDAERRGAVSGEQVIGMMNQLIGDAMLLEASDIHLEPRAESLQVRYRIDGKLMRRSEDVPLRYHQAIVNRLKAMAEMKISERRKPQDGRLSVQFQGRELALRLSTLPTRFGEKVVMRVLDKANALMSLDRIVIVPHVRELTRELIKSPHGILMITGPTGSGKTTTMYSAILEKKDEGINIVTIEDPIEYTIPGITQVQYNESVDLGFAEAVRSFMRQDPDVIMVGETRDERTAAAAMAAALSGHLVVTSFHTNSAIGTIYRLMEMGVENFLIGNALAGIIAQRLVRTLCPDCRQQTDANDVLMDRIYGTQAERPPVWIGRGCSRCNNTGYRGRTAVIEVLPIGDELRDAIATGQPMAVLRRLAQDGGMVTFRDYCKALLGRGLTTPSEVARVLYANDDGIGELPRHVRCTSCSAVNDADNRFCEECGAPMQAAPVAPTPG